MTAAAPAREWRDVNKICRAYATGGVSTEDACNALYKLGISGESAHWMLCAAEESYRAAVEPPR